MKVVFFSKCFNFQHHSLRLRAATSGQWETAAQAERSHEVSKFL